MGKNEKEKNYLQNLTILKTSPDLRIRFFSSKIEFLKPASDSARLNAIKTKRALRFHKQIQPSELARANWLVLKKTNVSFVPAVW